MSYARTFGIPVQQKVRYPASNTGGEILFQHTVNVNLVVDTESFDRSAAACRSGIDGLTASVAHAALQMTEARKEAAAMISRTITDGFFGMIRSELSQQKILLETRLPALLQELKAGAGRCLDKKGQLKNDFERISGRYGDVFRKLDNNLSTALEQLDAPAFKLSRETASSVFSRLGGSGIAISILGALDFPQSENRLTVAKMKQSACQFIADAAGNMRHTIDLNVSVGGMLCDECIETLRPLYAPVLLMEQDPCGDKTASRWVVPAPFRKHGDWMTRLRKNETKIRFGADGSDHADAVERFLRQKISRYAETRTNSAETERIVAKMLEMWKKSKNGILF